MREGPIGVVNDDHGTEVSRRSVGAMLLGGGVLTILPSLWGCVTRGGAAEIPDGLSRARPQDHGVDAQAVLGFLDEVSAAGLELHSFMLYRHGHVVAEGWWWPYRADRPHMMHSLTKSVAASGVGFAISEGRFGLDDKVISFFPEEAPAEPGAKLAAMTVRDLLTMQTGHAVSVSGSVWRPIKTSWVREFFKIPVDHQPGTTFVYSSAASFMLSAIVSQTTGRSLYDYLEPRLFRPLGIRNAQWDTGPGGINPGGNGLSWTSADMLKLGILHAQKGQWEGRQLLPAEWVYAATRPQVPDGRYGYQWWIEPGKAYYAAGAFGQFSIVFPDHDAVLAITSAVSADPLFSLLWKYFPAAFTDPTVSSSQAADAALYRRCKSLRLLAPLTGSHSPRMTQISGKTFQIRNNEDGVISVRFDFKADRCVFSLRDDRGEHTIAAGLEEWIEGDTSMTGNKLHHQYQPERMRVVAGGRWLDERTFEMTWQFVESAFCDRVLCRFDADTMTLDRSVNVNSAATSRPTLQGTLVRAG